MMTASSTLSRYLMRTFLFNFCMLMLILLGIIYVFEGVELLRRSAGSDALALDKVMVMSLMKLPFTGSILMPFGMLFSAIYTCWKLNKTHELVVIRAAGLSVWQFLAPLVAVALLVGVVTTAVINPVSAIMLSRFQGLEEAHLGRQSSLVAVSSTGIWLRQPAEGGYALIHAAALDQQEWRMSQVIVYFFDNEDNFIKRVDSPVAYLKDGHWDIRDAQVNDKGGTHTHESFTIPTELNAHKIEETFADADTISFWNIPEYISIMEETGFPTTRLRMHFQSLLAKPLMFAAMILLAATFSLQPPRFGGTGILIALGVGAGFFVFLMESTLGAFGVSQKIPAALAAWTPATVALLLGITALLHLEDG